MSAGVKEIVVNVSQEAGFDTLDRSTNIPKTSMYRMSPLHELIWHENLEGVEEFIKENKESGDLSDALRATDRDGRSPLIYAVITKQIPMVKHLLEAGAPVNFRTNEVS
jgi:ankyrin repeat protein